MPVCRHGQQPYGQHLCRSARCWERLSACMPPPAGGSCLFVGTEAGALPAPAQACQRLGEVENLHA